MGAILEIWALGRADLERRLKKPAAAWDRAMDEAAARLSGGADREPFLEALGALARRDWDQAFPAVAAIVRSIGRPVGELSINSSVVGDFIADLTTIQLGGLLSGAPFWTKRWEGDEASFGYVPRTKINDIRSVLTSEAVSALPNIPVDALNDALDEAEWDGRDIVTIWV